MLVVAVVIRCFLINGTVMCEEGYKSRWKTVGKFIKMCSIRMKSQWRFAVLQEIIRKSNENSNVRGRYGVKRKERKSK